jgi:hypothetical protein
MSLASSHHTRPHEHVGAASTAQPCLDPGSIRGRRNIFAAYADAPQPVSAYPNMETAPTYPPEESGAGTMHAGGRKNGRREGGHSTDKFTVGAVTTLSDVPSTHASSSVRPPCCLGGSLSAADESYAPAAPRCAAGDPPECASRFPESPAPVPSSCFLLIVVPQSISDNSTSRPRIGVVCDIVNTFCWLEVLRLLDTSSGSGFAT